MASPHIIAIAETAGMALIVMFRSIIARLDGTIAMSTPTVMPPARQSSPARAILVIVGTGREMDHGRAWTSTSAQR